MTENQPRTVPPIAIVGVSALLPGEPGAEGFWRTVASGEDQVTDVPATHWLVEDHYDPDPTAPDKSYARRGAFLAPVPFDPLAFGIPPKALEATDTSQLLAMVAADQLLSSLGPDGLSTVDRERTSVILGTSSLELLTTMGARIQRPVWHKAMRESGISEDDARAACDRIAAHYVPWQEATLPGLLSNVVAGRVANRFDLHGSNYTTDAACASSLAAVSSAINELALGQADLVVTGGVDTLNDPVMYTCFSKTPALSRTGDCRPFAEDADGMILGEGIVMFALRRLADAERDGDRIFSVIRGVGTASDGQGGAIYAPQSGGQARALRRAYETAGYGPDTVGLLEAHGTGTAAGDAAEVAALRTVFGESGRTDTAWCALGSVKSQIGHTKNAAGAAGLLKATLALHHKVLPPTIKVDRPNPALGLDGGPFYLNTQARPWISDGRHPRRASVSSFGFGGTDFHVTLEEHCPPDQAPPTYRMRAASSELVPLSAESPAALATAARELAADGREITAVARKSQDAFDPAAPARLAVVASSLADLAAKLRSAADRIDADPVISFAGPGGTHYGAQVAEPGRIAFLFSGQGSQYVGMGAELAMLVPGARESWDAVTASGTGGTKDEPLHRVVFPPPVFSDDERAEQRDRLTRTEWAQPALAAQSLAVLSVLDLLGVRPDALGGHSFGELVALHAAGCFDNETLMALSRRRGELMRDAASVPGAMTAVIGDFGEVGELVEAATTGELWIANHNARRQVVVSGAESAVAAFERRTVDAGYTVRRLEASAAFHSPLVADAAAPFRRALDSETIAAPRIPVYANADATTYPASPDAVRAGLARQLEVPVRFVDQIEAMYADGVRTFVEVGANATLTRFTGDILADREHRAVSLDRAKFRGADVLHEALGRLAVGGLRLDFAALWNSYGPVEEEPAVDTRPSMTVDLLGANYAKPYPPAGGDVRLPPPAPPRPAPAVAAVPGASAPAESPTPAPATPPLASPAPAGFANAIAPANETGPAPEAAPGRSSSATEHPAARTTGDTEWLHALRETQRQAGEAHAAYQRAMADSHLAFLRLSEVALTGLSGATPAPPPAADPLWTPAPEPIPAPVSQAEPVAFAAEPPVAERAVSEVPASQAIPEPATRSPQRSATEPVHPSAGGVSVDVAGLLGVVAEKTGYPVDVLDVGMELESDLGIDSIKRVEILSAVRERFGVVAEVDGSVLGAARTLGEVAGLLGADTAGADTASEAPVATETTVAGSTATPVDAVTPAAPLRLAFRPVSAPAIGLALPGLLGSRVAITGGTTEIAAGLAKELAGHGIEASAEATVPPGIGGVIHLGELPMGSTADSGIDSARSAFSLAREFSATRADGPGVFVTVQDTGGDFGLAGVTSGQGVAGGAAALARTAAREWPGISVKALDLDTRGHSEADLARLIAGELLTGGTATDVGLGTTGRTVLETTELGTVESAAVSPRREGRIGPQSVIVASGGARGVTAAALCALAEACAPRIVLIGRTPLTTEPAYLRETHGEQAVRNAVIEHLRAGGAAPEPRRIRNETARVLAAREIRDTLGAMEAAGAVVRYVTADVTDTEAVRAALDGVRAEWGPITGIVHGAGVLADKHIRDKTDEQFDRVLDTKVGGLRSLLAATAADPLDLLCVFSSVAACYGNAGQSDYAMANEIATQLAAAEQAARPDCLVRSIAWGPWEGGMVDTSLAAHFRAAGTALIPLASGARAFVDEILGHAGPLRVVRAAGHPESPLPVTGELALSAHSHPYLTDHTIAGTPVLPVAMVLEWFTGAARAASDSAVTSVAEVEVLSKIALDDFADQARVLRLAAEPAAGGSIALTLHGQRPHFRGKIGDAVGEIPEPWSDLTGLSPLAREIYDGHVLFHGPAFQALVALDGLSPDGASGTLAGTRRLGWPGTDRHTDPAAVDGALQLATLWAERVLGTAVLPMGLDEFRLHVPGPLQDTATVLVRAGRSGGSEARCDVRASGVDGQPIFELRGVRLVARPDSAPRT
ncbi:beta keto-acyl synthase [Amycolatopsis antarctica]|uniref:Beta keto-acyl synthase n=1 Tax=Amycolatopsis antarctica TaxID=1854586 RepID=A0A263CY01_9PSEU|nr:type I polyketide synthase [Amycolatopsis antarctica]OZM70808.1 beta keto-acyl synthase [Amycolatopsis antarctica]